MKVLLINGSPHKEGCTYTALQEMMNVFKVNGIESELIYIGNKAIRGCIACRQCKETSKCIFDDEVNRINDKLKEADGLVLGSPVYYAGANGTLISLLDRLLYSGRFDKTMKVGAAIVSARRAGTTAAIDQLNKYFMISSMPVVSSSYWNMVHGSEAKQIYEDKEGIQTLHTLANNMVFLMKSIQLGKETYGLPIKEEKVMTNFVR